MKDRYLLFSIRIYICIYRHAHIVYHDDAGNPTNEMKLYNPRGHHVPQMDSCVATSASQLAWRWAANNGGLPTYIHIHTHSLHPSCTYLLPTHTRTPSPITHTHTPSTHPHTPPFNLSTLVQLSLTLRLPHAPSPLSLPPPPPAPLTPQRAQGPISSKQCGTSRTPGLTH